MNKNLKVVAKFNDEGFAMYHYCWNGTHHDSGYTTMIVRSQGDQLTASAQKQLLRSLAAAETVIPNISLLVTTTALLLHIRNCERVHESSIVGECVLMLLQVGQMPVKILGITAIPANRW